MFRKVESIDKKKRTDDVERCAIGVKSNSLAKEKIQ